MSISSPVSESLVATVWIVLRMVILSTLKINWSSYWREAIELIGCYVNWHILRNFNDFIKGLIFKSFFFSTFCVWFPSFSFSNLPKKIDVDIWLYYSWKPNKLYSQKLWFFMPNKSKPFIFNTNAIYRQTNSHLQASINGARILSLLINSI